MEPGFMKAHATAPCSTGQAQHKDDSPRQKKGSVQFRRSRLHHNVNGGQRRPGQVPPVTAVVDHCDGGRDGEPPRLGERQHDVPRKEPLRQPQLRLLPDLRRRQGQGRRLGPSGGAAQCHADRVGTAPPGGGGLPSGPRFESTKSRVLAQWHAQIIRVIGNFNGTILEKNTKLCQRSPHCASSK